MAEIVVLYLSEDVGTVESLVERLRLGWDVWWARDIQHGDWEGAVLEEIPKCKVVIPVLSDDGSTSRLNIITDEMHRGVLCRRR